MHSEALALIYLALSKWATYLGLIGLTGALVVRRLVMVSGRWPLNGAAVLDRTLLSLATYAAGILAVAAIARLYAQTYSVFGLDEPVTVELLHVVGGESRWGNRWQPQAGFALLALVSAVTSWWRPRSGWCVVTVSMVMLWLTLPLTGHAMTFTSAVPWGLQVGHGLAVGLWIGTIIGILVVVNSLATTGTGHQCFADLVQRFSLLAVVAAPVVVVTGVLTAWFYLDTVSQLWTTTYGITLLIKLGLMFVTGVLGAYNWRRVTPKLGNETGTRILVRTASVEVGFALLVLGVTAVLIHLAMPHELE